MHEVLMTGTLAILLPLSAILKTSQVVKTESPQAKLVDLGGLGFMSEAESAVQPDLTQKQSIPWGNDCLSHICAFDPDLTQRDPALVLI